MSDRGSLDTAVRATTAPPRGLAPDFVALPTERLRPLQGWAHYQHAAGYVWEPATIAAIAEVFTIARESRRTIAPRGSGYSYTDAALNREAIVLDLHRMNRVIEWNEATGQITVEPGVTIRDLWNTTLPDGWWPKVVPGTMGPTIGGALAMNVHGKNAWNAGPIGDHVLSFDLMTPNGIARTITREADLDRFRAVIGGLGMLGVITRATLQMRRVTNGRLQTRQRGAQNLAEMFAIFAQEAPTADYLVGWIDGFAGGNTLGRGLVERADLMADADPASLAIAVQDLPPKIAGVIPRAELWRLMKPAFTDLVMRQANNAQYLKGSASHGAHVKPHAQFHFFHDYLPNWQRAWLPGGLRQFQVFLPARHAQAVFAELLQRSQRAKLPPYLAVFKQHRDGDYLLPYELDGFSLSLDYKVTAAREEALDRLLHELVAPVLAADGRFYLAKDDSIDAETYAQSLGQQRIDTFLAVKRQLDPEGLFSSNLFRRVFREAR